MLCPLCRKVSGWWQVTNKSQTDISVVLFLNSLNKQSDWTADSKRSEFTAGSKHVLLFLLVSLPTRLWFCFVHLCCDASWCPSEKSELPNHKSLWQIEVWKLLIPMLHSEGFWHSVIFSLTGACVTYMKNWRQVRPPFGSYSLYTAPCSFLIFHLQISHPSSPLPASSIHPFNTSEGTTFDTRGLVCCVCFISRSGH